MTETVNFFVHTVAVVGFELIQNVVVRTGLLFSHRRGSSGVFSLLKLGYLVGVYTPHFLIYRNIVSVG